MCTSGRNSPSAFRTHNAFLDHVKTFLHDPLSNKGKKKRLNKNRKGTSNIPVELELVGYPNVEAWLHYAMYKYDKECTNLYESTGNKQNISFRQTRSSKRQIKHTTCHFETLFLHDYRQVENFQKAAQLVYDLLSADNPNPKMGVLMNAMEEWNGVRSQPKTPKMVNKKARRV